MPGAYKYIWNHITEEWEKAPAVVTTTSMLGTGQVGPAGAHKLYWVVCSPDAPGSEFELSDDTDGSTAEVYCHFDSDKHSEHLPLDPPMPFTNGIYVKKFDKIKCLHFGYI